MDGWESKGVSKRSFAGMACQWVSVDWEMERVCLGIPEMTCRKRADDLKGTAAAVMRDMEVSALDAISFTTDHEQAQRNAVKTLAETMVGCSCHGIQLPPRHVLPLVREKRQVAAGDDESDSSSESSSDNSSESEEGKASDRGIAGQGQTGLRSLERVTRTRMNASGSWGN